MLRADPVLPGRIPGGRYFQCPGKADGRCEERAFCYPRYKRTPDKLATYLQQRGLKELPPQRQFHFHEGIDVGKMGDEIVSVVRGKVVKVVDVYTPGFSGYGKGITVQADDSYGELGGLYFFHGHCERIVATEGATVEEGDVIAIAGNTDYTPDNPTSTFPVTQAHLHFEVSRREWSEPARTLRVITARGRGLLSGSC